MIFKGTRDLNWDVVIVGAGAAGMTCAIEAARRGRRVVLLEHNQKPGEKIRISGGGRCNFTNIGADARTHYLSANTKFALSAMRRFTPRDFIGRLEAHGISWHEKKLGQLFCDQSAQQVIDMLTGEMADAGAQLRLGVEVSGVERKADGFVVGMGRETLACSSLVVATGGKSIPKMGASGLGYAIAEQFGLDVTPLRPGLVPLTFSPDFLAGLDGLAGVSVDARVRSGKTIFEEALLFTHRGLSGPAILQISNYWREGAEIEIDLAPGHDVAAMLDDARKAGGRGELVRLFSEIVPHRLAQRITAPFAGKRLADFRKSELEAAAAAVKAWRIKPTGTEGYRTAEVTLGGVSSHALNASSMEAREVPGLYFIGEVVDVTGWLGGYNFQWAWASGYAAGQSV